MKLRNIIATGMAVISSTGILYYFMRRDAKCKEKRYLREHTYYETMYRWIENKNAGKSIESYFIENQYKTIAIYGAGTLGELLYEDIKNSKIEIAYFIDKSSYGKTNYIALEKEIYHPAQISELENVDAIIVTPIFAFQEIKKELKAKGVLSDIISLEDIF